MVRAPPVKVEGFSELMGGDSTSKHDLDENRLTSPNGKQAFSVNGCVHPRRSYEFGIALIVIELFLWFSLYSSSHSSSHHCHQSPCMDQIYFTKLLHSGVLIFARDVLYTSAFNVCDYLFDCNVICEEKYFEKHGYIIIQRTWIFAP